jgi:hypothetical protein
MGAILDELVENCLVMEDSLVAASLEVAIGADDDVNCSTDVKRKRCGVFVIDGSLQDH